MKWHLTSISGSGHARGVFISASILGQYTIKSSYIKRCVASYWLTRGAIGRHRYQVTYSTVETNIISDGSSPSASTSPWSLSPSDCVLDSCMARSNSLLSIFLRSRDILCCNRGNPYQQPNVRLRRSGRQHTAGKATFLEPYRIRIHKWQMQFLQRSPHCLSLNNCGSSSMCA